MASKTEHLDLLIMDPVADKDITFNLETMMNENWRKLDEEAKRVSTLVSDKSSFRVGSYVGTGDFGEGSTSITFNAVPALVIMLGYTTTAGVYIPVFGNFSAHGDTKCVVFPEVLTAEYETATIFFEGGHGMGWSNTTHYGKFDKNTLYWYNTIGNTQNGAPSAFNKAGYTYYYMYFYN